MEIYENYVKFYRTVFFGSDDMELSTGLVQNTYDALDNLGDVGIAKVLKMKFGICGYRKYTYKEIAADLCINISRARSWYDRGIRMCRVDRIANYTLRYGKDHAKELTSHFLK